MTRTQFFPTILILLDFGAAFVYLADRDWRMATYWIAAGTLTICVTW